MKNTKSSPAVSPAVSPAMPGKGLKLGAAGMTKPKNFKKSMGQFVRYLSPFYVAIIVGIILAIAGTVCSIMGPDLIGKMTNVAYTPIFGIPIDFGKILYYGVWLAVLYSLSFLFSYAEGFILSKIAVRVAQKMRGEISAKINRLPLRYFDRNSYGDTLSRVTNDVDTISQTLNQSLSNLIVAVTMFVGVFIMMLTISWQLTLVAVVTIPIGMIVVMLVVKRSQKYYRQQQQSLGEINGHVEEVYSNHNVVKAFNGQQKEMQKFAETNNKLFVSGYKSQFYSALMMPIMSFIGNLSFVGVSVVGGILALNGQIEVGSILSFFIYIRLFNQPLVQLASVATVFQSTAAASERVFEFLAEPEIEPETANPKTLKTVRGEVEFKNVRFGYQPGQPVIPNFSAKIKAGQKVAIVGPTGAGKTTLVNLLERFYELDDGDIEIDGISIKDMTRAQVRSLFGMVLQDAWLFEATVLENLIFGNPKATQEEVELACKSANVHHFITTLSGGYQHKIGEESSISQGQRQLLTIARAMVQNAPMLILDEATSSVDTRTEELIQKAMDKLSENRTSFVIAHRLSTIKNANVILVVDQGNIVERGTHSELLKLNGKYATLYNSQFKKDDMPAEE